ncbi:MAG: GIY-YIG nuclease family protein [Balneolaceae bacterium]
MKTTLYILQSQTKHTYYIGVTQNLEQRLQSHNTSAKGYTRNHRPWNVVYQIDFESKEKAKNAETVIKRWKSKRMIQLLIDRTIRIEDYI